MKCHDMSMGHVGRFFEKHCLLKEMFFLISAALNLLEKHASQFRELITDEYEVKFVHYMVFACSMHYNHICCLFEEFRDFIWFKVNIGSKY